MQFIVDGNISFLRLFFCKAIWNVIKKLLNAEQQKFVLLVKKPQITQYIDRDQLLVHLGGSVSRPVPCTG